MNMYDINSLLSRLSQDQKKAQPPDETSEPVTLRADWFRRTDYSHFAKENLQKNSFKNISQFSILDFSMNLKI